MITVTHDFFDIATIADSGQCFRCNAIAENRYRLIAQNKVLCIEKIDANLYRFDCSIADFDNIWKPYFDFDTDYGRFCSRVAAKDAFLQRAVLYGVGMRILRQDAFEMLITFIISQRKNIPAIKKCVETLCSRFGAQIGSESDVCFAFPSAQALAAQSLESLRACALGYRAAYVKAAATMVATGALDLEKISKYNDASLYDALLSVPGVGAKVANCVMLFGFYRIASFPQDVWINRMIDIEYGGNFPLARYRDYAGVMQQYIFYYARSDAYAQSKKAAAMDCDCATE